MLKWLGKLADSNEKELKRLEPLVNKINELEADFKKLSDGELRSKTDEFKARLKAGETLDELLPEAFAAVREAARRTIGQRHYDVQLMGGIVLHQGKIAEMKTGEGKTLVATLPLYLNSLGGQGCHLATVNDYLARRDPYWMGPIYHALGLSVASIFPMQTPNEPMPALIYDPEHDSGDERWRHFRQIRRPEAYQADIIYGTSSEFGFDYLRDNMVIDLARCVQCPLNYTIVDEVDNLLIDEARTPLIISAPDTEAGKLYQLFARLVRQLTKGQDYEVKEKERSAELTDAGWANMEAMLNRQGVLKGQSLYDPQNAHLMRHLRNALSAKEFYKRNQQYVVKNGEVIIVDEFTGRMMLGRRYSEGLHQAIEAQENVKIQQESRTFATVTIQNYFRMYQKLAGMTGTAATEAEEFHKIYKLEVVAVPTHQPMIRQDYPDRIYKDEAVKFKAVVHEIEELHKKEQPLLIGTVSIENSESLSQLLKKRGIRHQVLNAKEHVKEAEIIARAGEPGAVTVATNMAGRGVDIILGGREPENGDEAALKEWRNKHKKVIELGGLQVIGTERHEARRIDNQLRGRSGRQGDPGGSRFYVSLEDSIMRRFGGERIKSLMEWAGMDENTPIENPLVSKSIENAQKKVEGYHFDIRKHLVDYDDVVNKHREIIFGERRKILEDADLKSNILAMVTEEVEDIVASRLQGYDAVDWDLEGLINDLKAIFPTLPQEVNKHELGLMSSEEISQKLSRLAEDLYNQREQETGAANMRLLERLIMLRTIDSLWVEHLTMMEYMRLDAGWQTLRQVRAVDAYKNEGHKQFQILLSTIKHDVAHTIYRANIIRKEAPAQMPSPMARAAAAATGGGQKQPLKVAGKKIGRNDPCPCGSGKKYKKCCGR
ncbi:MAG: preprotein translocase subunit SecA [Dehalococcoidales bacterium]